MNERGKEVDTTFLSIEQAANRGFLHRDYIAHCFRWSHVIKRLMERKRYSTARVLDIGCGRELPFAKTLYSSKMIPEYYVGVDAGPMKPDSVEDVQKGKMADRVELHPNTLFSKEWIESRNDQHKFTDIVCFEVAEHVEPAMLKNMLAGMVQAIRFDVGRLWISTPCWDYKSCAANHVNEMTYAAFAGMLCEAGFHIEDVHGTFASISDYRPKMNAAYAEVFEDLREYYDSNVLSTIFAPMFPAQSRNALWECRIQTIGVPNQLQTGVWKPVHECQQPWGSSHRWREMASRASVDDLNEPLPDRQPNCDVEGCDSCQ